MSNYTTNASSKASTNSGEDGFCQRFSELLAKLNVSQNEFARRIGSTSAFISNIARGKAKPGLDFLQKISTTFDVSLDWLIMGKGSMHGKSYIESEWYHTVKLRVELAKLIVSGSVEAQKLAEELSHNTIDKSNATTQRKELLSTLAQSTKNDAVFILLYNLNSDHSNIKQRAQDVLSEAIRLLENKSQDPLTQILDMSSNALEGQKEIKGTITQHVIGINNKVAGRDYHEK